MRQSRKPNGFTVVELTIVILLLGVISAVALPRFTDVSDEAHQAVVSTVYGNFATGMALFRAAWYTEGAIQGALVQSFGNGDLYAQANTSGEPAGFTDSTVDANTCSEAYQGLLQGAAPEVTVGTGSLADDDEREIVVEAAAAANPGADFIAVLDTTAGTFGGQSFVGCTFYYVGQYRSGSSTAPRTIQVILYGTTGAEPFSTVTSFDFNDD